jgi:uncharacterized membrane protein
MTNRIESGIDVEVPVSTAYNQWTQFEDFPRFMKHVEMIQQLDDKRLHWRVNLGGKQREFDAEIVEQIPDKRIAWRATSGARHAGVVTFHRLDATRCRVMLQLEYDPEGFLEKLGTFVGVPQGDVEQDLQRFAKFIEHRQTPTGAWRGTVPNPDEQRANDAGMGGS